MKRIFLALVLGLATLVHAGKYTPSDQYTTKQIEGWTIRISPDLINDKPLLDEAMAVMQTQLYRTARRLPPKATEQLQSVVIWMEKTHRHPLCACYHELNTNWLVANNKNPDKHGCVEIGNARNFIDWTIKQPWMMLHELAHAYHDRLPDRFQHGPILDAYKAAMDTGKYDQVLRINGKTVKAYATNNQMEYFAEGTEAFFGTNDFYPYVRSELKKHDPRLFRVLKSLWGHADHDNYLWDLPDHPESMPWDLTALAKAPSFEWIDTESPVRSLYYQGELFNDKPTRVFAYYASPGTLAGDITKDHTLPAVVLVHGGGGTAFREWAELWAKREYAAIAMDLGGCEADRKRMKDGCPDQNVQYKFLNIDEPVNQQWQYHAVANVIRAHSLIRSFPGVDEDRTAVTGISWGGYLTCMVLGLDRRFSAAVPVYGCGFLQSGSVWDGTFEKMTKEQLAKWHKLWDPSRYVGTKTDVPALFVNGTNDFAYWMEQYHQTYSLKHPSKRSMRITVKMPHGHQAGWNPKEIGMFIDQHLLGATPLPKVVSTDAVEGKVRVEYTGKTAIKSVHLHYTTQGPEAGNKERDWTTVAGVVQDGKLEVDAAPDDATIWFVTIKDDRDAIVSSELTLRESE